MSQFGGPGGGRNFSKPTPPQRGSFPLDHDAVCASKMKDYLTCIRAHRGMNDEACRQISKGYLVCRMENNLMAPDEMRNLGYGEGVVGSAASVVDGVGVGSGVKAAVADRRREG
ncbi:hypothetical protein K402DRAFT_395402 [Aulographum hederae CBS 113979]|uniref:CHCH domain-containing protein n=1 Tax=Aulographum hederae CBS 113979 TaxID=1176131 RepID=A0A6G1GV78_9PEZI|nr:hypothetical protein K402DRAFT_395402 [Aulographum hederae CBS 113979]